jgi:hypothetical protein
LPGQEFISGTKSLIESDASIMRIANTFKRMLLVVMMIMKQVDTAALTDDLIQFAEAGKINLFLAKEKRFLC